MRFGVQLDLSSAEQRILGKQPDKLAGFANCKMWVDALGHPGISGVLCLTCYALGHGHVGHSYVLIVVVRIAVFAAFGRIPFPPEVCGRLLTQRTEALAIWRCSSGRKTLLSQGNLNPFLELQGTCFCCCFKYFVLNFLCMCVQLTGAGLLAWAWLQALVVWLMAEEVWALQAYCVVQL